MCNTPESVYERFENDLVSHENPKIHRIPFIYGFYIFVLLDARDGSTAQVCE